jgi:hypothetical protein
MVTGKVGVSSLKVWSQEEELYNRAVRKNWLDVLRNRINGQPNHLLPMSAAVTDRFTCSYQALGRQTVSIGRIVGSAEVARSRDFDRAFRPLKPHLKKRWLNVAARHQKGGGLPPVELFQVGDRYFIQDGHHRISVARALGHDEVDAHVTLVVPSSHTPQTLA